MKKFFKKTEGFTLVELVVVIAILGILAGVGTVGYSGYIKKANMAVDQQLASQVANALQLKYYSDPVNAGAGQVILTTSGATASNNMATEAMEDAFGENWEDIATLKYDGWGSNASDVKTYYTGSSFDGKEQALMGTIDDLSGALGQFLGDNPSSMGDTFSKFLADNGIDKTDSTKTANAAVLYVADVVNNKSAATKQAIADALAGIGADYAANGPDVAISNASGKISTALGSENPGGTMIATCAVLYAYAEAYCQYSGDTMNINFNNITKPRDALDAIQNGFTNLMLNADTEQAGTYFGMAGSSNPAAAKDAMAVMSALGAVDNVAGSVMGNLGSDSCYSDQSTQDLVNSYFDTVEGMADGSILVLIHANGETAIDAK